MGQGPPDGTQLDDQRGRQRRKRIVLLLQLGATVAVLGWLPGNLAKLIAMIIVWGAGFRRISGRELIMITGVNLFFSIMDFGALDSGIMRFRHPDLFGLPIYEFFMWGFYTLHALRFIGDAPAKPRFLPAFFLAVLFAIPFATISQPIVLFCASSLVLFTSLAVFREPLDFAYTGYLIAVGCVIEYVGVWTGQWAYPGSPLGGVALWFIPMWGGVGLFTGRLIAPLIVRHAPDKAYSGGAHS